MALLSPDLYYADVRAIDLEVLRDRGVEAVLLDIDNTILPRDRTDMPAEYAAWARRVLDAGFGLCLVSNNWHAHVQRVAEEIGVPMVPRALKPLPYGFLRACRLLGVAPRKTAIIGDQLFTDIVGGNVLGMVSVLVRPLSATDLPHTLVLRRVERLMLAGRRPLA